MAAASNANQSAADWPRCPQCGARRSARCPICETVGSDFAAAEMDLDQFFTRLRSGEGPCCGPGGCTSDCPPHEAETPDEHGEPPVEEQPALPTPNMVLCPLCDEPFEPLYLRRCAACGHEFQDGISQDPSEPVVEPVVEAVNWRVMACIAAVLALAAAAGLYFARLF